ncbi:MAG: ATP synthase F1 subunit delta [Ktedonobacterales bacterium]
MIKGATARRYAEAVFEIGVESNQVDSWRIDLETIASYFGNKRLQFILREPKVPFQRKEQVVRDLLADKLRPEALNLAFLLVERDLVDHAPAIYSEFEKRYNDYKGQAIAQVTTAIPLDADLREQVRGELAQMTGKRIILQERVDPSILGGAVARIGDTLIDGSLKRRFALLRDQIARGGDGFASSPDEGLFADLFGPAGPGGDGAASGSAQSPDSGSRQSKQSNDDDKNSNNA